MPDAQRSCETCLFFRGFDGFPGEHLGECRRNAPVPDVEEPKEAFWPIVAFGDWCGQWQPKATPQARDCQECERLRETVKGLADRVAAQSEMLSRKAEKSPVHP